MTIKNESRSDRKMKRFFQLMGMLILTIAIVGCNQTEDQEGTEISNSDNEAVGEESTDTTALDEMTKKMDKLDYSDFELEVKYEDDIEYEAELEQGNNSINAEIDDELNDVNIKGEEAFNKLFPKIEQLTIEQNTEKDAAIDEVLNVFDLDTNYIKLELEVTFNDGVKLEYEDIN